MKNDLVRKSMKTTREWASGQAYSKKDLRREAEGEKSETGVRAEMKEKE